MSQWFLFLSLISPAAWSDRSKTHYEEEEDQEDEEDSGHEVDDEDCPGEGEDMNMLITHWAPAH